MPVAFLAQHTSTMLNSFNKYLGSSDGVPGILFGVGFKVMSKTVVNVAHKLPTDSNGVGEALCQRAVGRKAPNLAWSPRRPPLHALSALTGIIAVASKWSLPFRSICKTTAQSS